MKSSKPIKKVEYFSKINNLLRVLYKMYPTTQLISHLENSGIDCNNLFSYSDKILYDTLKSYSERLEYDKSLHSNLVMSDDIDDLINDAERISRSDYLDEEED